MDITLNSSEHTIDYVLIPTSRTQHCTSSQVVEEFDLGNLNIDHSAVAIELSWKQMSATPAVPHRPADSFDRSLIAQHMKHTMDRGCVSSWSTDVELHLAGVNAHFRQQLSKFCPRKGKGPVKPNIDGDLWQLRRDKLHGRQRLNECRGLLRREL